MSGGIKRGLAVLVGVLLLLASLWSADPAAAGGPTSVILVSPGTGLAAALHTSDPRYEQLVEAVGAYQQPTGEDTRPARVPDCEQCEIRLTWLIHDVQVWRVDRVHRTADDGIWLESVADETGGNVRERPGLWHRPQDAATLSGLLDELGVTAASDGDPATPDRVGGPQANAIGGAGPTNRVALIAIGCALAGGAIGLVSGRYLRRRSRRDPTVLTG